MEDEEGVYLVELPLKHEHLFEENLVLVREAGQDLLKQRRLWWRRKEKKKQRDNKKKTGRGKGPGD